MYFILRTDEGIERMVEELTPFQKDKFETAMLFCDDRRQALFVASSWPRDMELGARVEN